MPTAEMLAGEELKLQDAPVGSLEHAKLTWPVNPFKAVAANVIFPDAPGAVIVMAALDDDIEKSGQALTRLAAFTEPRPVARS